MAQEAHFGDHLEFFTFWLPLSIEFGSPGVDFRSPKAPILEVVLITPDDINFQGVSLYSIRAFCLAFLAIPRKELPGI